MVILLLATMAASGLRKKNNIPFEYIVPSNTSFKDERSK